MDTVWLRRLSTLAAASQVPAPTEAATRPAEAGQTSCAVESGSEFEESTKGSQKNISKKICLENERGNRYCPKVLGIKFEFLNQFSCPTTAQENSSSRPLEPPAPASSPHLCVDKAKMWRRNRSCLGCPCEDDPKEVPNLK